MRGRHSVALGFLALIVVGAVLLAAPFARADGRWGAALPAAFTACSAVCVTGLTVVDIARELSFAGQLTLLVLVEIGCLGLMTCGTFLMVAIGRRLSLAREFSLMNAYGVAEVQGLKGLILWVVGSMLFIEAAGALALYLELGDWWQASFYSVMSFCNAGFSLRDGSVAAFAGRPAVIFTLAVETILGGIGFLVIYNLCTFKFRRRKSGGKGRLSLHTRVVLRFTAYLLVIAFVVFLWREWDRTLAGMPLAQKLWVGFYQAVTPRTCGFSVVATEALDPLTRLFSEVWMFIGGAPGSAAAGIKVTTLAVLIYTLKALCRGNHETIISRRVISFDAGREAIVIFMALSAFIVLVFAALLVTESATPHDSDALLFEAVSAITTTGLSMGSTTVSLTSAGKLVIMAAMFAGRLGALTVVMMIGDREETGRIRYPSEELVVG